MCCRKCCAVVKSPTSAAIMRSALSINLSMTFRISNSLSASLLPNASLPNSISIFAFTSRIMPVLLEKVKRNFYSALRPSVNALFGQPHALTVLNTEGVSRMSEVITVIPFSSPHSGEASGLLRDLYCCCCPSSVRLKFREAQPSDLHFPPFGSTSSL